MGTHPIFESDFDCLTEFILHRVWSLSLSYSICWLSSRHRGTITTAKGTSCCVDNAKEVNPATVMTAHAHKVAKPDGLGATARHPFVMMSHAEKMRDFALVLISVLVLKTTPRIRKTVVVTVCGLLDSRVLPVP